MIQLFFPVIILPFAYGLLGAGTQQSVSATGRLMCDGEPASGVEVYLYDEDVVIDASLGQTKTDDQGYFTIHGTGREITKIDPLVKIYHNCYNKQLFAKRQLWVWIPEKYVTEGKNASKVYDFFQIELSGMFHEWCPQCTRSSG